MGAVTMSPWNQGSHHGERGWVKIDLTQLGHVRFLYDVACCTFRAEELQCKFHSLEAGKMCFFFYKRLTRWLMNRLVNSVLCKMDELELKFRVDNSIFWAVFHWQSIKLSTEVLGVTERVLLSGAVSDQVECRCLFVFSKSIRGTSSAAAVNGQLAPQPDPLHWDQQKSLSRNRQ